MVFSDFQDVDFQAIKDIYGKAIFKRAKFFDCDFFGADLSGFDLSEAVFESTSMRAIELEGADLRNTQFLDCDITHTSFREVIINRYTVLKSSSICNTNR